MKRCIIVIACIIAVFVLVMAHTSCVSNNNINVATTLYYDVGDTITTDRLAFTITQAKSYDSLEIPYAKQDYVIYGIYVTVTNVGISRTVFDACQVNAFADNVPCIHYMHVDDCIDCIRIEPGDTIHGWIYYVIPKQSERIYMTYHDDDYLNNKVIIRIK